MERLGLPLPAECTHRRASQSAAERCREQARGCLPERRPTALKRCASPAPVVRRWATTTVGHRGRPWTFKR